MKLTEKDKEFLEKLKQLLESKDLSVELKPGRPSYMVLRGTYGEKIHETFHMSRQGVRWRFHHLFAMYVAAFESILAVESIFGSELRDNAIRISQERYALRQEALQAGFQNADVFSRRLAKPADGKDPRPAGPTTPVDDAR